MTSAELNVAPIHGGLQSELLRDADGGMTEAAEGPATFAVGVGGFDLGFHRTNGI